jgi:hypothetical protein
VIYVTDIHPLVFWSSNRKTRLGRRGRRVFRETEQGKHAIIAPIAIVEEISRLAEREFVHWRYRFVGGPKSATDLLKNFRGGSLLVT